MRNKAVFFDRDGIINIDKGYVSDSDDFEFVDGIHALIRHINSKKLQCIVVTNQSGIARGMYSVEQFKRLTQWMVILCFLMPLLLMMCTFAHITQAQETLQIPVCVFVVNHSQVCCFLLP